MDSKIAKLFVFAVFAAVIATSFACALSSSQDVAVTVKGIDVTDSTNIAAFAGETIPIKVVFTADESDKDVKLKAWISGYRSEIQASTQRMRLVDGNTYSELLSLTLPSDIDPTEDYDLIVRLETKTAHVEYEFHLVLQRESYNLDVLAVDAPKTVEAGQVVPIAVVVKNRGFEKLEDVFVRVSIASLGVDKTSYYEDLSALDCENDSDCETTDARERIMYVQIPDKAEQGAYTLSVEAYNDDSSTTVTKTIAVSSEKSSEVLTGSLSKAVERGSETVFELIIVNPSNRIRVYNVLPQDSQNLVINVDEPVLTVPADSSKSVLVRVKPTSDASDGATNFVVNVNSDGKLVKSLAMTANVSGKSLVSTNPIVILTVVLAIIFVVLLIVLIVLLTRKPAKSEEFSESYY